MLLALRKRGCHTVIAQHACLWSPAKRRAFCIPGVTMGLLDITVPEQGSKAANLAEAQRMADNLKHSTVTSELRYCGQDTDADGGVVHYWQADTDKPERE